MSQNTNLDTPTTTDGPQRGQFPFALSDTNEESKYLTWLRNHTKLIDSR